MTGGPDREAIIDAVAREKPWRTPPYLVLYFMRRWAVVLFTLSFMLGTRQHWAVAAIAVAGALWLDLKITPNALDLRLTDREFVRKIYDCEVFEENITKKSGKLFDYFNIVIFTIILATIFSPILIDYDKKVIINDEIIYMISWLFGFSYILLLSINCPISNIPPPHFFENEKISLNKWKDHGYYGVRTLNDIPFIILIIIFILLIFIGFVIFISFSSACDKVIQDYVVFAYANMCSAMGFCSPIMMNIHAKGQRVAQHLVKKTRGGQES